MKRPVLSRKTVIIAAAAVILLTPAALRLIPSQEEKVKKRFHLLSEYMNRKGEESLITLARKAQKAGDLFSDPCEIRPPRGFRSGSYSPREIAQKIALFHAEISQASLAFSSMKVEFPDSDTALVLGAASLKGRLTDGEPFAEAHAVLCELKKIEGVWLFSQVRVIGQEDMPSF